MTAIPRPRLSPTRPVAPLVWAAAALLALLVAAAPASYADEESPSGEGAGMVLPSNARPGESVQVHSTGWPAAAQVQAVVCGDAGLGGSGACDLPNAVLGRADADGVVDLALVVAAPPEPCPCVVRVTSFSTAAEPQNLALNVVGHTVGTPPPPEAEAAEPAVGGGRFDGEGGLFPGILLALVPLVALALPLWSRRRRRRHQPPAGVTPGGGRRYPLPPVVWVEDLGALVVDPRALRTNQLMRRVEARITSADLARLQGPAAPADVEQVDSEDPLEYILR